MVTPPTPAPGSPSSGSHPYGVPPPPRRRTVRIVKRRNIQRAAIISLAVAAAAAGLLLALWRMFQTDEQPIPHVRTVRDVHVEWLCELGHAKQGLGGTTPQPCWRCGRDSYPIVPFRCPVHGTTMVSFQFAERADGQLVPVEVRAVGGAWEPFTEQPHCGQCRRLMTREVEDPFERDSRKPFRRDGRP